jgi:DNA-binding Lrp family transcriptional regulator
MQATRQVLGPAALRLALLNDWQRRFPLVRDPFAQIGERLGLGGAAVISAYRALLAEGALSRIGGVFGIATGGAALLAAMAVPRDRVDAVAAVVSAQPGVNHNYEREHRFNLWFVITGADAGAVEAGLRRIEADTGLAALRLPMQRAYRIDLGFDLRRPVAPAAAQALDDAPPVDDCALAALVEQGLPLVERPFDAWGDALGRPPEAVIATLARWLGRGTLRRFGAIVRHHELGFAANAMTVFDVPDERVDACGAALAREAGVTLAYRRARASGWPYNLYCMVHGRDRGAVRALIELAAARSGLAGCARSVLFSRRRFKQVGARRFRSAAAEGAAREFVDAAA